MFAIYYPKRNDVFGTEPCVAVVCSETNDRNVNLSVFDRLGHTHSRPGVYVLDQGEEPPKDRQSCRIQQLDGVTPVADSRFEELSDRIGAQLSSVRQAVSDHQGTVAASLEQLNETITDLQSRIATLEAATPAETIESSKVEQASPS